MPIGHPGKLGHPLTHPTPVGIEASTLEHRIEDAKPWLGIEPDPGRPLPAASIVRDVTIDQIAHEVALTDAMVHQEMARQERGHHQTRTIAERGGRRELAHGRVHDRDASASLAPLGMPA